MTTRSPISCRYYVRGICRFGTMCRFSHADTADTTTENYVSNEIIDNVASVSIPGEIASLSTLGETSSSDGILSDKSESTSEAMQQHSLVKNDWAMAPIFVPKLLTTFNKSVHSDNITRTSSNDLKPVNSHSYAEVAGGSNTTSNKSEAIVCPFVFDCPYGEYCVMIHFDLCDMCGQYALHPTDKSQRKKHINECLQQHEKDMELSFAIARSNNKTCGICFDIIMGKNGKGKRFGILPNCNHIFCLDCIRKWRQAKQFENKITRSCPECRIPSDFVCPSAFWVETKDDKDKVINEYKQALGEKDCKYFNKGEGKCPFGNKCFYKHALPNGIMVDVGVPQKRKVYHHLGLMDFFSDISFYEFISNRDVPSLIEYWSNFEIDDSDDSDWNDD